MQIAIWFIAGIISYFLCGFNLAIVLSKAIYHEDIRTVGSGNPGFTNFKRVYGSKYAWFVFAYDLLKCAICCAVFSQIMVVCGIEYQTAAAFIGLCCMLGHSFPIQYKFKGGKGFLVCLSALFFIDWRAGLIAAAVLTILLLTTKYMSLSTMICLITGTISLIIFQAQPAAVIMFTACTILMIILHKENIIRLIHGNEKKFTFGSKKSGDQE